jgi:antitoxin MazE
MNIQISKWGNSLAMRIPASLIKQIHLKEGDKVESGDIMSDGIVNPAEIVQHKGIGEGRRYFTEAMRTAFGESGMGVNRRNFELISRGAVDHVRITHPDGLGDHLPDAIVGYQSVEKDYKPRADSKLVRIDLARGQYLEEPVLHYTIGTRVTSRVIDKLKEHNIESVKVHNIPPPFEPEMVRLLDVPAHVPDWAHQLYSTYLEKRLINAVNTGMSSSVKGPSPVLGLAYGVGFGDKRGEYYEPDDTEEA